MVLEALASNTAHLILAAVTVLLAAVIVHRVDAPAGSWKQQLQSRLLYGVPWGTLIVVAFVIGVYLFVQGGLENPNRPVVIPFRGWSYFYPEGMLWSGYAHSSRSHITGNLLSTLVAGALAEYAYGHFPRERETSADGSDRSADAADPSVRTDGGDRARTPLTATPYVRAFGIVPGAILLFGGVSSLFALGPVIGFSGVVFALWGFALVHYPIGTIAALSGSTLVSVIYSTILDPIELAAATSSYGPPSWANIAIQGHALGFLSGVLVATWLLRRRRSETGHAHVAALTVFVAVLLFGASRRFWAVYWYLGNERYELYRALGLALMVLLALIVAVAVAGRERPLRESIPWLSTASAGSDADPNPDTVRSAIGSATPAAIGLLLVILALAAVAGPGILPNLVTVDDGDLPGDPIEIEGYQVTYAEGVEDQMVNVIDIEAFGRSTSVTTSGVIVQNAERQIWTTAVSRGSLEHWGYRAVELGGTGWRETVWAERSGWVAADGGATYRVDLIYDGDRSTAFVSEPERAEPRIDGRTVTVAAIEEGFELRVEHEGTNETAAIPERNESVTLQEVTFTREDGTVFAERGDTEVRVAEQERYEGRERS
ncbi:rhomboid family intramembrane serine protease [Halorubrum vacuolatum]|uniref:Membrane associated serine protease, rhomboid family n=1 Tax=Halorubrum vacuolatum TaxID=63740 RepID=A0A238VBQ3_HALVU|nr:rhomboid family intramembrane serine protease [Halorubrum vacuolatum]SNR31651.1 Membrane associated serine protease, rhomboid family [Halorubrum vacuolatum]